MEFIVIGIVKFLYNTFYELYYILYIQSKLERNLLKYSRYYSKLAGQKSDFRRMVWEFIRHNEFIPREDLSISFSLKVIIASHAIQLSFKLGEECYDYYEKIIVYKDYYRSRVTKQYHKAEVNPGFKIIVFSVRAINESLNRDDDGLNVLLHEFAHALWLEHLLMHHEYQIFNPKVFDEVKSQISDSFESPETNESHFFRKYAFKNEAEFFAVAVENFFERSAQFQLELPYLYDALAKLFQQDPLAMRSFLKSTTTD